MRVSGVNLFSYNHNGTRTKSVRITALPCYVNNRQSDMFSGSISFNANPVANYGQFRALTKTHDIHCIYCGKLLLYGGSLNEMLEKGLFSGSVKDFIDGVMPYRNRMKKGQKDLFDRICKFAKRSPQTHLSEIVQFMYQKAIKKLVKKQSHVLNSMISKSGKLPIHMQEKFDLFIQKHHDRLYGIPHKEEFIPKKFAYQINKKLQSIPNAELQAYLSRITTPMNDSSFSRPDIIIPDKLAAQISKSRVGKLRTAKEFSEYVIYRVRKIGERLDRQDIVKLCDNSQKMINEEKVVIPFSNKELLEEMVKHQLAPIRKSPLYYEMVRLANSFPNSSSSMNSFVVKHRYSDSDTIGYKLLEPAITTIEHEKPRSLGGSLDLTNCVLACKADNNARSSNSMANYLKFCNKKNPQRYFNDVIKISNEQHLINPSDIEGQAKNLYEQGHITVNLSKLRREE